MNQSNYFRALVLAVSALALTACSAPEGTGNRDSSYPDSMTRSDQVGTTGAAPVYYRGSERGMAAVNSNDAAINADVINALSTIPGLRASNIQVSTLNGVVSLDGMVDSQATAQDAVQAARQVSGVRSVNYNLQIR